MENIQEDSEVQTEEKKPEVIALPIWLGARLRDNSDLDEFLTLMHYGRGFTSYKVQELSDIELREHYGKEIQSGLDDLFKGVESIFKKEEAKIAVFYIVTAGVAESNWFKILREKISALAPQYCFYTIVVGGGFKSWKENDDSPYDSYELNAHQLDAVHLPFNSDAPTAGMRRLMEMINRVMGADLPGEKFPDYNQDDLRKLAWHISRESFNSFGKKTGAIAKYNIDENGRPIFNVEKQK